MEACEYDRSFLELAPEGAIVTNVEADHLDYYQNLDNLERAFGRYVDRVHPDGLLVVGSQVPERIELCAPCEVWRLGREIHLDLLAERRGRFGMRLRGPGWATPGLALSVPGSFNAENAALALALALGLATRAAGGPTREVLALAARRVAGYRGAARRFEPWGLVGGVELVHDYAHHPTEVAATLEAARRAFPACELHVLFQPHQHSRTARFLLEFVESLRGADRVVVAQVYGARTHVDHRSAGAPELVACLRRAGVEAVEGGDPFDSSELFAAGLPQDAAGLVLGAGDIDRIRDDLRERLALRGPAPG